MTESTGVPVLRVPLAAVAFGSLIALALFLYVPWRPAPFDILDFSELLPILSPSDAAGNSFFDVTRYYRGHGRSNLATSALISLNWEMFGENPLGWRFSRTVLMAMVIAAMLRLLMRLGIPTMAAAVATATLVVSRAAAGNWLRLTGEPLALLCFILALHAALGHRDRRAWRPAAAGMAVLVSVMLLTKETMIVCVPAIVVVALCVTGDGDVRRPENRAGSRGTLILLGLLCVVFAIGALVVARTTDAEAYVRVYGSAAVGALDWLANLQAIALPLGPATGLLGAANLAFALLVLVGTVLSLGAARETDAPVPLVLGLSGYLLLAGALVYLPWGRFEFFYGLPFALGSVLLLAVALDEISRRAGRSRPLVWTLAAVLLAAPTGFVQLLAARTAARRELDWTLAEELVRLPAVDSFVVAVRHLPAQRWQSQAATFRRVALMIDPEATLPSPVDKLCEEAHAVASGADYSRVVLASQDAACDRLPEPTRTYRSPYEYFTPFGLRRVRGEVRASLVVR